MAKYYLYKHTRLDTNEVFYIGFGTKQDKHINKKIYERANSKSGRNKYWHNIVKLNPDYKVEIFFECNNEKDTLNFEMEFIKQYGRVDLNTGSLCNFTNGGECEGGRISKYKITEEHKKKLVEGAIKNNTGRKLSSLSKQRMSESHKGKKFPHMFMKTLTDKGRKIKSDFGKTLIGDKNPFYGKKHSIETLKKLSTAVEQYDLVGNKINEYYSMVEAAKMTNSTISLISKVCKKERKTHNGFIWKYKNK